MAAHVVEDSHDHHRRHGSNRDGERVDEVADQSVTVRQDRGDEADHRTEDESDQCVDARDHRGFHDEVGVLAQRVDDRAGLRYHERLDVFDLDPRLPQRDEDDTENDRRQDDRQAAADSRSELQRSSSPATTSPTWVPRNASRTSVTRS